MAHQLPKHLALEYRTRLAWLYDTADIAGVPSPQDIGPIRLDQIYVPLRFRWNLGNEFIYLPQALDMHRHLVILGDPGSGKSTLIKVIVDMFGRTSDTPLKRALGELLPIPIILRDYNVRGWKSYDQMLAAFLQKFRASVPDLDEAITLDWLIMQLRQGKAILLFDGLDEVGSRQDREHLRDQIIIPLLLAFEQVRAVLTSRSVGYDEVPFDQMPIPGGMRGQITEKTPIGEQVENIKVPVTWGIGIERYYVAPFSNEDIEQFVVRWYSAREPNPELRREGITSLQAAIHQNERVHSLATNPQLLTLMAIVHRAFAELPSGRVELYDKVAEAYLLRIDRAKKLASYPASLDEMKRWLARVGWEMQSRRKERENFWGEDDGKDLLATKEKVEEWLQQAIAEERGEAGSHEEAERFLDHIARRSGLLIPRGPEDFAFAHLTFQEYFAACHLGELAFDLNALAELCAPLMERRYWHETLCILFEILAKKFRGVADRLFDLLYKKVPQPKANEKGAAQATRQSAAELFSELLLDEQNGLTLGKRKLAADFTLAEICRQYNSKVIGNLKLLPSYRSDELLVMWFEQHLQHTSPNKMGRHFFVVGNELLEDWPQQLVQWVATESNRKLSDLQVAQVALFAAENDESYQRIGSWAVEKMSLLRWLSPISYYSYSSTLSLADAYRKEFYVLPSNTVKLRLLGEAHSLATLRSIQTLRWIVASFSSGFLPAERVDKYALGSTYTLNLLGIFALDFVLTSSHVLDFYLGLSHRIDFTHALNLARRRALLPNVALARSRSLNSSLSRNSDLASALARAISSPRSELKKLPVTAEAERLFFAPDASAKEFETSLAEMRQLMSASNDWARLQGFTALLSLGAGSPELLAEQNALLEKGIRQPKKFTFPAALHAETETPEFRMQLHDLFKLIFQHDPDDPETHWLKPEFLDPTRPESKYFLSKPREFFILAADALDPDGETELGQWRRGLESKK